MNSQDDMQKEAKLQKDKFLKDIVEILEYQKENSLIYPRLCNSQTIISTKCQTN